MNFQKQLNQIKRLLRAQVTSYTIQALVFSFCCIVLATFLVSWQTHGEVTLDGIMQAQLNNPALWFLNLTPFLFAYWGQKFFYTLIFKTESFLITESHDLEKETRRLELGMDQKSHIDETTGLFNHKFFLSFLEASLKEQAEEEPLILGIMTLSNMKEITCLHGDYNFNKALRRFAKHLMKTTRNSLEKDKFRISMMARLQSDEFGLIITDIAPSLKHEKILEYLSREFAFSAFMNGKSVTFEIVIGASLWPTPGDTPEKLMSQALGSCFYAQKEPLSYAMYNPALVDSDQSRPHIFAEIKKAIKYKELEIFYQPVYDFVDKKIIGAEALARLNIDAFGVMTADSFIPLIEGTSLIKDLSLLVLEEVMETLKDCKDLDSDFFITVNLSVSDIVDEGLPERIQKLLKKYHISGHRLHIDITEQACLTEQARSLQVLRKLAEMGIRISIEDFCSGYSSFVYLTNFPIHEIKIDKSFTIFMLEDDDKMKMVKAIIELAHIFNISVSAEGVENAHMMHALLLAGCTYGKGYYFSNVIDKKEFYQMLGLEA